VYLSHGKKIFHFLRSQIITRCSKLEKIIRKRKILPENQKNSIRGHRKWKIFYTVLSPIQFRARRQVPLNFTVPLADLTECLRLKLGSLRVLLRTTPSTFNATCFK